MSGKSVFGASLGGGAGKGRLARRLLPISLLIVLLMALVQPVGAALTPSTFEGNDGNIVVTTPGNIDWETVAVKNGPYPAGPYGFVYQQDKPVGSTDNAMGQGSKEDASIPTVVTGSIPPNKSDLTRFYAAHETVSGQDFLYLAWERNNVLGTANMDFEIHKSNIPAPPASGPWDLQRQAGDILITFDFTQGGGNPVLGLLTWVTSGSTSQCFANNSLPCWGNHVDLTAAGDAEGQVNQGVAPIGGAFNDTLVNPSVQVAALEFGEASINLDKANIFTSGECENLGGAFLKSRSSASFTAEIKDFIAPANLNIHNCGTLTIKKVTDPSPDTTNTSFPFTVNGSNNPQLFPSSSNFSLLNGGSKTYQVHPATDFSAAETVPANWVLKSASCVSDQSPASGLGSFDGTTTISGISVAVDENVTCTFTNQARGAIKVTKTSTKGNAPLAGVTFAIGPSGGSTTNYTTDVNGQICIDNLAFGNYSVQETGAPTGYHVDDGTVHTVAVNTNATCGSGNENTSAFSDTPLTNITLSVASQVDGGTSSTLVCVNSANTTLASGSTDVHGNGSISANDLVPGTYTCTVVVDP